MIRAIFEIERISSVFSFVQYINKNKFDPHCTTINFTLLWLCWNFEKKNYDQIITNHFC